MRILILVFAVLILVLAGCSTQTTVKYQCVDGSFVDSANLCSSKTCPEANCPKLDCASCPVKTETKVETETITNTIYVCSDLREVKSKDDCLKVDSEGWYEVKTFTLSSGNSESFKINSDKWRYTVSCDSIIDSYNYIMNIVKIENGQKISIQNLLGAKCSNEPSYVYEGNGEYFFSDINTPNARNWKIKVEAQK